MLNNSDFSGNTVEPLNTYYGSRYNNWFLNNVCEAERKNICFVTMYVWKLYTLKHEFPFAKVLDSFLKLLET